MNVLLTPESLENLLRRYGFRIRMTEGGVEVLRGWIRLRAEPASIEGCSVKFRIRGFPPFVILCMFMKFRIKGFRCGWNHVWIDLCSLLNRRMDALEIEDVKITRRGLLIRLSFPGGRELGF